MILKPKKPNSVWTVGKEYEFVRINTNTAEFKDDTGNINKVHYNPIENLMEDKWVSENFELVKN